MRIPVKVGAVYEPQRTLGGPGSLFASAAENGAKFGRKMAQTLATAPQIPERLIFARISTPEIQSKGGAVCKRPRVF